MTIASIPATADRDAFMPGPRLLLAGAQVGPLAGLSFAAKDVFDVAGSVTGNGHPFWRATHAPAAVSAVVVERMLRSGASLAGKTVCDELCYSLTGENVHYGTPLNPAAHGRVPGGSSSGSASAVAAGLVDVSLGSDCGGSVRVPASYCGIFGMRPTHGLVPLTGAVPFAPSFDCAGWFARDAPMLERVGAVLFAGLASAARPMTRLLFPRDAFAMLETACGAALTQAVDRVAAHVGQRSDITLSEDGLGGWSETFRTLQAGEIWTSLGSWIEATKPEFGPGVRQRFVAAANVDPQELAAAKVRRAEIVEALDRIMGPGTVLVLPTVPRVAPLRNSPVAEVEITYRNTAMNLLCVAGLAGLPQISLPLAQISGLPLGVSIVGGRGSDLSLLALARDICPS